MKRLDAIERTVSLLIGLGMIAGCIAACIMSLPSQNEPANTETVIEQRFTVERLSDNIKIITDTETGVNYLWFKRGYGAGLTVLVDETGRPVLQEDFHENDE